ncbi:hypothetical protein CBR_g26085 [Chara braunii]|uniref:Integrase catalytic domain-containing protein n=1 Tax=Chara braunii TaxID=69332 RepID=A0A388JVT9_CHABU|nr:hypothetical protein CBR_g26085 [Chara braunii]|eukprot:GBG61921.1 hypothetical protein CBR_g26085 [Chara braunii]
MTTTCGWRREDGVVLKRAQWHRPFRPPPVVSALASFSASIVVDLLPHRVRRQTHFRREDRIQRKAAASSDVFGLFIGCGRTTHTTVERQIRLEVAAMEGGKEGGRALLTSLERVAVSIVVLRCQQERVLERMKEQLRARRRRTLTQAPDDGPNYVATSKVVIQLCYALGCGVILRATLRWSMKRRTGGTWEDLRQWDNATDYYFWEKLRMSPRVFREIMEACAPHLQRRVTFYREPLQPGQIVAYTLYRWASGKTYESSTCNFRIGRASGLVVVCDVTITLLRVYGEKITWPTGVRKLGVLRAFVDKGFPNCHGCIDCTHIYVDKPANAPSKNYYDKKRRFSIVAQVVIDLDLRVLDVHMGYPGSCHDIRVLQLSSLLKRAVSRSLFRGPPVTLPLGVRTNGYVLADNGYPPSEWMVVSYGGVNQHVYKERFDNKQKVARGAVERGFGWLKGMWRLFLRTHKTNLDTLPRQFTVVYILHNVLIDAGIPFDENLLWEVDANVLLGGEGPLELSLAMREREAAAATRAANIADQVALLRIPEANADRFQEGLAVVVAALVRLRTLEDLESRVTALEQRNEELQVEIISLKQSQLSAPRPPNPRPAAVPVSQSNTVLMARASGTVTSAGSSASSSSGSADSSALVIVPNAGTSAQNAIVPTSVQYSGPMVDKRAATLSSKYDGKTDVTSWISSMRSYFEVMRTPQEDRSMIMGTNTEPAVRNHIELQAVAAGYERIDLTEWLKTAGKQAKGVEELSALPTTGEAGTSVAGPSDESESNQQPTLEARNDAESKAAAIHVLYTEPWEESKEVDFHAHMEHWLQLKQQRRVQGSVELTFFKLLINRRYIRVLIDSGSTTNFFSPNGIRKAGVGMKQVELHNPCQTQVGNQEVVTSTHAVKGVRVTFDRDRTVTHELNFYVMDKCPFDAVIGLGWLKAHCLRTTWADNQFVVRDNKGNERTVLLDETRESPLTLLSATKFCKSVRRHKEIEHVHVAFVKPLHVPSTFAAFSTSVCQRTKVHRHKPYGLLRPLPIPDGPGESISIDFTDMGKVSEAGNSQVMVIVDHFSKFLNLIPFPSHAPTELVIEEFHQQYILQYGQPKTIVSDRDTRFISKDWKDFTSQIYDIKLNRTSGRHPEANGLAEEINQTIIQLLRALIVPDQNTWDKELHKVKGLYNNFIHSATGVTPNQLQYGWPMRKPLSYLFPERSPGLTPGMPGYNAKYARLLKAIIAAMNKRQHAMIKHANKLRKEEKFKVGDYVWVKMSEFSDEEGISRKLIPLYYGPWQILKVVGDDFGPSYVIDVPPHPRTYPVFHASKLFPHIDDEMFPYRDPMIPRPIDGDHEIDRIVSHEGRGRNRQYKVHFLYHPLTEFFWIDRKELLKSAPCVVNAYERQIAEGQTAKFVAKMTPHGLTKSLFLIYSYDAFCANSE